MLTINVPDTVSVAKIDLDLLQRPRDGKIMYDDTSLILWNTKTLVCHADRIETVTIIRGDLRRHNKLNLEAHLHLLTTTCRFQYRVRLRMVSLVC